MPRVASNHRATPMSETLAGGASADDAAVAPEAQSLRHEDFRSTEES
jgi:hypothetical protein